MIRTTKRRTVVRKYASLEIYESICFPCCMRVNAFRLHYTENIRCICITYGNRSTHKDMILCMFVMLSVSYWARAETFSWQEWKLNSRLLICKSNALYQLSYIRGQDGSRAWFFGSQSSYFGISAFLRSRIYILILNITNSNRLVLVALLVEHWTNKPKIAC